MGSIAQNECLFSAAEIARLKNTVSLPSGKLTYWRVRFSRANATVSKVHTLFNCCILRTNPYGEKSKRMKVRQKNASAQIVAYADKATKRIRTKMKQLEGRGKNYNVASAAGYERTCMFCMGNDERQNCVNSLFTHSKVWNKRKGGGNEAWCSVIFVSPYGLSSR